MGQFLDNLLEISSGSLCSDSPSIGLAAIPDVQLTALLDVLRRKSGFYAFESALHVFPSTSCDSEIGLDVWNSDQLWKNAYEGLADSGLFFAEDVFGSQFSLKDDGVYTFDPETGDAELLAPDLESWAKEILGDYEVLTGFPLAHEWQASKGTLQPGTRLVPKIPFVMGGEFQLNNLYACESVKAMRLRGDIARQIRDLPDGSKIQLKVIE